MRLRPVAKAIEDYMGRTAHARGHETKTMVVGNRNAFSPAGATYTGIANGLTLQELSAPTDDFKAGDEVVVERLAEGTTAVRSMADLTRRPTQAPQYGATDVTGTDIL